MATHALEMDTGEEANFGITHGIRIEGNAKTGRALPVARPISKFQPFSLMPVFWLIA